MPLTGERCVPCEGGTPPLTETEARGLLAELGGGWQLADDSKALTRELKFKDFAQAMGFLNRLAEIAEAEGHHPDFRLHDWNRVSVTLATHAIGGLSRNDFILAAKANQAVNAPG